MMNLGFIAGRAVVPAPLLTFIEDLALDTALDCVLDAGDAASYTTGQTWTDVKNGNDFYRGGSPAANVLDPSFAGVAGGMSESEYFYTPDTQVRRFQEAAAHTFAEDWHKNNATWTALFLVYIPSSGAGYSFNLFSTAPLSTSGTGVRVYVDKSGSSVNLRLVVTRGASPAAKSAVVNISSIVNVNSWNLLAVSIDEADVAGGFFYINGITSSAFDPTYTSPAAGGSDYPYAVAGVYSGEGMPQGFRIMGAAFWSRAVPASELDSLYAVIKAARAPSLP